MALISKRISSGCSLFAKLPLYGFPIYGKCSKISNTFLFLFSIKMLIIRAGNHKMLDRKANREDPDQTDSLEAV